MKEHSAQKKKRTVRHKYKGLFVTQVEPVMVHKKNMLKTCQLPPVLTHFVLTVG